MAVIPTDAVTEHSHDEFIPDITVTGNGARRQRIESNSMDDNIEYKSRMLHTLDDGTEVTTSRIEQNKGRIQIGTYDSNGIQKASIDIEDGTDGDDLLTLQSHDAEGNWSTELRLDVYKAKIQSNEGEIDLLAAKGQGIIRNNVAGFWHVDSKEIAWPNGRSWSLRGISGSPESAALFTRPSTVDGTGSVIRTYEGSICAEDYTTKDAPPEDLTDTSAYWNYTPFMATEEKHVATKKYVDSKMIVSETEPDMGVVGQQWFQPSTGNLHVYTGDA